MTDIFTVKKSGYADKSEEMSMKQSKVVKGKFVGNSKSDEINKKTDESSGLIQIHRIDMEDDLNGKRAREQKVINDEKRLMEKYEKKEKKEKKKRKRNIEQLTKEFNLAEEKINNGMLLSEVYKNKKKVLFCNGKPWEYLKDEGYFMQSYRDAIKAGIRTWAMKNIVEFNKLKNRDFNEAYSLLSIDEQLQTNEIDESYNKPYVLCKNGVLDLKTMKLIKKSPRFQFVCMVHAKYDEKAKGSVFEKFLDFATGGDKDLKKLIQEVIGYVLSNYTNIRKAVTFIGPKHTGKSLILDIIRCLANELNCSAINIQDFEKDYHVSKVLKCRLNIASDLPSTPICGQISKFKSITSELDVVTARDPYNPVFSGRGRIKCLFGTNNHFKFKNVDKNDLEAFFDRIIYIPFIYTPDEKTHDDNLKEKLSKEYDYIFTWAMKGLQRLIENDFKFTKSEASEECKAEALTQYSPLETFYNLCIKEVDDGRFELSENIKSAFINYCRQNGVTDYYNIKKYLDEKGIPHHKKRIDEKGNMKATGSGRSVYEGIRIRKKYRYLINNN